MTDTDLAYLAGFIDGEGTVSIRYDARANSYSVRLSVANTNEEVMKWVASTTGARLYYTKYHADRRKYTNNEQWKPVWTCVWLARRACDLMKPLLPHLKVKKERAALALEFQERLSREKGRRGHPSPFTDVERAAYHTRMRELNKKTHTEGK